MAMKLDGFIAVLQVKEKGDRHEKNDRGEHIAAYCKQGGRRKTVDRKKRQKN
jgi:hypothetical protein